MLSIPAHVYGGIRGSQSRPNQRHYELLKKKNNLAFYLNITMDFH